jgi:hypothetical protein
MTGHDQKGTTKTTKATPVKDPGRRLVKDRPVKEEGLSSCCKRELRVSGNPSWVGDRRHCGVCGRQAVVDAEGSWVRGR